LYKLCGEAVRRDILRSPGVKPAVYGYDQVYARLVESERYRFQLSRPAPSACWRHERKWRLPTDLSGSKLKPDQGFVFVRTMGEKAKLCRHVNLSLPVVVFDGWISGKTPVLHLPQTLP
jgi:hypothetical protein